MTEVEGRILKIVRRLSDTPDLAVSPAESLFESGILDSFGLTDLVAALELEFGIQIPDSDLRPANFSSIQAINQYLESRTGGA